MAPKKRPNDRQQPPNGQKRPRGNNNRPNLERNESRNESSADALSIASMAAFLIVNLKKDPELMRRLRAKMSHTDAAVVEMPNDLSPEQADRWRKDRYNHAKKEERRLKKAKGSEEPLHDRGVVGINEYALRLIRKMLDDKARAKDSAVGSPGYASFRKIVDRNQTNRVCAFLYVVRYTMLSQENGACKNPFVDLYLDMLPHLDKFDRRKFREGLYLCGRTVKETDDETKSGTIPNGQEGFRTLVFHNPMSSKAALMDKKEKDPNKKSKPRPTGTPIFYFSRIARLARKQRGIIKKIAEGPRGEDRFDQDGCPAKGSRTEVAYRQIRVIGEVILGIIGAMGMPSRTAEIAEQMTEAAYLCKIKRPVTQEARVVPFQLALAIDMAAGKNAAGPEPQGVMATTIQSKCKEKGDKRIATVKVVSYKRSALSAFTYRMGALQQALQWPLRTQPSRNGDFPADGLLIGSTSSILANNACTHLGIDRGGGLYGPRYAFAICFSELVRAMSFSSHISVYTCMLYHHVKDSNVREEVYADAAKSSPVPPFTDKMIRNVPSNDVPKWESAILSNNRLYASGVLSLEADSLVTEEAVQAALWHTAHTTIPGLEAIARGDFPKKKGAVRETSDLLAKDLLNTVDKPATGPVAAAAHQALAELTRPKSWAHLWQIYQRNFPVPDFDELNFGRAGVDYPESVYETLVADMQLGASADADEADVDADADTDEADADADTDEADADTDIDE